VGTCRNRSGLAEGAVVATVTVTLAPGAVGFGETVHVDSEGAPAQVKATASVIPPSLPTIRVYVAACPGVTADDDEDPDGGASVKSSPMPAS